MTDKTKQIAIMINPEQKDHLRRLKFRLKRKTGIKPRSVGDTFSQLCELCLSAQGGFSEYYAGFEENETSAERVRLTPKCTIDEVRSIEEAMDAVEETNLSRFIRGLITYYSKHL